MGSDQIWTQQASETWLIQVSAVLADTVVGCGAFRSKVLGWIQKPPSLKVTQEGADESPRTYLLMSAMMALTDEIFFRRCGLMDKASASGAEDSRFESELRHFGCSTSTFCLLRHLALHGISLARIGAEGAQPLQWPVMFDGHRVRILDGRDPTDHCPDRLTD